jgi:2-polyprenyl-3-methyl-5-hydroxy-6-metoxy-1,4-benzoquinol methylase/glycosyltransferase involved in cell wall biosynthesis/tetratricopeptide (TPR) repeat protein
VSQITACIITRDAPCLARAVASIRPHVDEIIIVDTGSTREDFLAMLQALQVPAEGMATVRVERFTACNDASGKISDFALARNRSFELARTPWVIWVDSDDELSGAENLRPVARAIDERVPPDAAVQVLYPYEYSYHPSGAVSCLQSRERLIRVPSLFRWLCPVHEVCLPVRPDRCFIEERTDVVWKHRRGGADLPSDPGRNLRIMRRWVATEQGANDARARFYLAQELVDAGEHEEALQHYEWHFHHSGWDDERMMGMLRAYAIYLGRDDLDSAERMAQRLVNLRDDWGEGWFALGRVSYVRADRKIAAGDPTFRVDTQRAIRHFQRGLSLEPTRTPLFLDPRERSVAVHEMLNKALNDLGDVPGALASCEKGLAAEPTNPNLGHNRKVYKRHLALAAAHSAIDEASACGVIAPDAAAVAKESLASVVNGDVSRIGRAGWPASASYPAGYPAGASEDARPVAIVTPHSHAWGIPEGFEAQGLPMRMTDHQLRSLVLALWHELLLHDEIVSAEALLENAPYRVRDAVDIKRALGVTRKMTSWMDNGAAVQEVNAPSDTAVECGNALPAPLSMAAGQRLQIVLQRLVAGERVLDLGCFDGSFTNRMGLAGFSVVGVDQVSTSVDLANAKAREFATGADHVLATFDELEHVPLSKRFEVVTTTDVWEHLRDPGQLVRVAEKHLLPGGRMLVVTPLGAWMRGVVVPWAHPWRWGEEKGLPWACSEPHAHLHAPSPSTVAREFAGDHWSIKNCFAVRNDTPDITGQGWVFCEAVFAEQARSLGKVAIVTGQCWERWTPRTASAGGIGGSETAVVEMAKRLAEHGWRVTVFGDMEPEDEGIYDGVAYLRHEKTVLVDEQIDVLVAWRDANLLNALPARAKLLWVHDIWAANGTHANMLKADAVMCLSDWHCDFVRKHHALPATQIAKTANGIDVTRFDQDVERDPHKVIYSSSPDRGLLSLLQMWPRIRQRVPDATLHVFYGFDTWQKSAELRNDQRALAQISLLRSMMKELEPLGVHVRGRVDQKTLAREMLSAGAFLFPTWFTETFCIGAAEAQCAGLQIVTSPIAALAETAVRGGGRPVFVEGDWLSPAYQEAFVTAAVDALLFTTDEHRNAMMLKARDVFDWSHVADQWTAMFGRMAKLEEPHDRLHPYVPFPGYTRS